MEPWPDAIASAALLRVSAPVLLVDEDERVLLFRYEDRNRFLWCPVGGGVEAGESIEDAARREIVEVTGFRARSIGSSHACRAVTSIAPDGVRTSTRRSLPTAGGRSPIWPRPRND